MTGSKKSAPTPIYGSDLMANLVRALDIPFVALNPGASFRGFHDSLVNFGENQRPEVIECTHEEISVSVAQGFAKAAGRPMAAAIHDVVGLQHASMSIFNAWCDRVPVILFGGTGPMDVAKRRPWIDWIHTALVQGNLIRDFVKWDDQPATLDSLPDSILRAYRLAVTEPAGPVYVCFDGALQEDPIPEGKTVEMPDVDQFAAGSPPAPDPAALTELAKAIKAAKWPVILADHVGRSDEGFQALSTLAERWAIPVIDLGGRLNLPTTHPMNLWGDKRAVLARADLVLALDVRDLFGSLSMTDRIARTTQSLVGEGTRVFAIGVQDYGVRSWASDFQRLYPCERHILADTKVALPVLIQALGQPGPEIAARKEEASAWHRRLHQRWEAEAAEARSQSPIATSALTLELWNVLKSRQFVLANGNLEDWVRRIFAMDQPRQYLGESGGGGLGYGIGGAIGAALAHRDTGKLVVNIQSDGDLMFTPGGLWTMAHHRLPVLNVMFNNRSYYNSEEHQINMARHRQRDVSRAGIGTRIEDPYIHFANLAESMGVEGIGPIESIDAVADALKRGLDIVEKEHRPVLIDIVTQVR